MRLWFRDYRYIRYEIKLAVRWAFSKCCRCGKRFKWGESPTTGNWNGTGPLWFRTEQGIYHSDGCKLSKAEFLKLPMDKRRALLEVQAEKLAAAGVYDAN